MERGELLARLETVVERLEKVLDDHETRLRALERDKWKLAGALLVVSAVVPVVLHFF